MILVDTALAKRVAAGEPPIRVGMINAFNDGFSENKGRYPSCNASAKAAQRSLGQRGGSLSRALARSNY